MFKRIFFQAILSSVLASAASLIYNRIYYFATEADFSRVLGIPKMIALNLMVCILAGFLYYGLRKWLKERGELVFNFAFSMLSFAAVAIPISLTLPLDQKFPELFPGLAVPMVFFPALAWFTVRPIFAKG
jgi:hypothetical protein